MHRLIWGFAGCTYHLVGNLKHWLISIIMSRGNQYVFINTFAFFRRYKISWISVWILNSAWRLAPEYKNNSCVCDGIEKSVLRITFWHHKACRVMTNSDREGRIVPSHPLTNNGSFFLLTLKNRIFIFKNTPPTPEVPLYAEMRH